MTVARQLAGCFQHRGIVRRQDAQQDFRALALQLAGQLGSRDVKFPGVLVTQEFLLKQGIKNMGDLRAKLPELSHREAEELVRKLQQENVVVRGIAPEDLLRMPHPEFFRRRGVPALRKVGFDGTVFENLDAYIAHLIANLPESYLAGRDFKDYLDTLRKLEAGEWTLEQAVSHMPALRRVGGVCPCSKSVRWVVDEPAAAAAG